MLFDNL
jgi:hypothetical protein